MKTWIVAYTIGLADYLKIRLFGVPEDKIPASR